MRIFKPNVLDVSIFVISIIPLISCHYGECPAASAHTAIFWIMLFVAYAVGRLVFLTRRYDNYIFTSIGVIMSFVVAFSIVTFGIFRHLALEACFDNLYYLRGLFRPLGYTNNTWSEAALVVSAFSMIIGRFRNVLLFLSVSSVLITFSRGSYITLAILLILVLVLSNKKFRIHTLCVIVLATLSVAIFCDKEMITTLLMNGVYSQRVSTEWRINATHSAFEIVKKSPILGYGVDAYAMLADDGDISNFSSCVAPNILALLLVEVGFGGLGLFFVMGILALWRIWKYRNEKYVKEIGCLFLIVIIREMAQATLLQNGYLCLLLIILLAYISSLDGKAIDAKAKNLLVPIVCLGLMCSDLYILHHNYMQTVSNIKAGCSYLKNPIEKQSDINMVCENLEKAINKMPHDANIKYILAVINLQQGRLQEATSQLNELAIKYPLNAVYAFSCGNAYHSLGEDEKAIEFWRNAIIEYPRLLLCKEYFDIQKNDSILFECLNNSILETYPSEENLSPKMAAKWGFILERFGYVEESRCQLRCAVNELPNLSIPWLLLGDKQKYNFLTNGIMANRIDIASIERSNTIFTVHDLFEKQAYSVRFRTWYVSSL